MLIAQVVVNPGQGHIFNWPIGNEPTSSWRYNSKISALVGKHSFNMIVDFSIFKCCWLHTRLNKTEEIVLLLAYGNLSLFLDIFLEPLVYLRQLCGFPIFCLWAYLMKVIPETYLMKVIPETYLMTVNASCALNSIATFLWRWNLALL